MASISNVHVQLFLTLLCGFFLYGPTNSMLLATDACSLVNSTMFCTCDISSENLAHMVSCFIVSNTTARDPAWNGFRRQKNIKDLVITSRDDAKLDFVPFSVISMLQDLSNLVIKSGDIQILWPYTFANISKLVNITLEGNDIQHMNMYAFAFLPNVTKISLAKNRIEKIRKKTFYRLPKLKYLFLEENRLTFVEDLAFVDLSSLEDLGLSGNLILNISFQTFIGLNSLSRLDLFHNRIGRLLDGVFSGAPMLRELDLRNNVISHISPHAFDGLNHLNSLRLNDNQIHALPSLIFKGTPNLRHVDLTNNRITKFTENSIKTLIHRANEHFAFYIKENPLICHCDLAWIEYYTEVVKSRFFKKELRQLKCHYPSSKILHKVIRLSRTNLNCSATVEVKSRDLPTTKSIEHHKKISKNSTDFVTLQSETLSLLNSTIPSTTTEKDYAYEKESFDDDGSLDEQGYWSNFSMHSPKLHEAKDRNSANCESISSRILYSSAFWLLWIYVRQNLVV